MSPRFPSELYDRDKDTPVIPLQYMLSPDIPPRERVYFEKYYLMFSKTMAQGNIKRWEVMSFLLAFDEICLLLDMGLYQEARQIMGREMMKMQCSRSIDGFWTMYGQTGVTRNEQIERVLMQQRKRGFGTRLTNPFRKKQPETYEGGFEE
jgi:hypothetical protein